MPKKRFSDANAIRLSTRHWYQCTHKHTYTHTHTYRHTRRMLTVCKKENGTESTTTQCCPPSLRTVTCVCVLVCVCECYLCVSVRARFLLGKTNARLQHLSSWDKSRCWPPQSVFYTGVKRSSSTVNRKKEIQTNNKKQTPNQKKKKKTTTIKITKK